MYHQKKDFRSRANVRACLSACAPRSNRSVELLNPTCDTKGAGPLNTLCTEAEPGVVGTRGPACVRARAHTGGRKAAGGAPICGASRVGLTTSMSVGAVIHAGSLASS